MAGKTKFHIGDIVTVITGKQVSQMDCPPIGSDEKPWPPRETTFDGTIQLIQYVTGTDITQRRNPVSGKPQFDVHEALDLSPVAREALKVQFPQLANLTAPQFVGDQEERDEQVLAWVKTLEQQFGAYHEVDVPEQKHRVALAIEEDQQRRGPPDHPSRN